MTKLPHPDLTCAQWRKSSYTQANGGNCVEVALNMRDIVPVRDSKDPNGPVLMFEPADWLTFTANLKNQA